MARPSLKDVRSREILDAFVQCVARYGLDGSTQDRIAAEAGVARPLLRHYLGNRAEMVGKLLEHILAQFEDMVDELVVGLPEDQEERWPKLFDGLFQHKRHSAVNASVFQALVVASQSRPELKAPLMDFILDFEGALAAEITKAYPDASKEACATSAAGVAAVYFTVDAMLPVGPPANWIATQRRAAERLFPPS